MRNVEISNNNITPINSWRVRTAYMAHLLSRTSAYAIITDKHLRKPEERDKVPNVPIRHSPDLPLLGPHDEREFFYRDEKYGPLYIDKKQLAIACRGLHSLASRAESFRTIQVSEAKFMANLIDDLTDTKPIVPELQKPSLVPDIGAAPESETAQIIKFPVAPEQAPAA